MSSAESEARKALARLRRAAEKAERELAGLEGALKHAEGTDFPREEYDAVAGAVRRILDFTDEEAERLREKILQAGGLEPGRVRRGPAP
jgi:Cdc6-like AAA superfamily ATPase